MTTFLCMQCGKLFEGDDLREVADRAFDHVKEHAITDKPQGGDEQETEGAR